MILANNKGPSTLLPLQFGAAFVYSDSRIPNGSLTLPADGTSMAAWNNLTVQNNLNQTTGGNQPVFKQNIINGLPVIRFDGNTQSFIISNTNLYFTGGNYTWFFVINPSTTSGARWLLDTYNGSSTTRITLAINNFNVGNTYTSGFTGTTGWQILSFVFDTSVPSVTAYRNGTSIATSSYATGFNFLAGTGIGSDALASFGRYAGDMLAVLGVNSALSSANHLSLVRWFGSQFSIATA